MIVVMATAVVWVLLHNETDKNVRKTAILGRSGNTFWGRVLTDRLGRVIRNIGPNILICWDIIIPSSTEYIETFFLTISD